MFGIMHPHNSCSKSNADSNYHYHRQHYCGTCKVIGKEFGHRSRLMLNFDTVFLAELLSLLGGEDLNEWESHLQSVNTCFSMPQNEDLPFSLRYAATASVLLGELKVDDQIKDSKQLGWRLAKRFYSKAFEKAVAQLGNWGIETDTIYSMVSEQEKRELAAVRISGLEECLDYYAEATARITATIFKGGAGVGEKAGEGEKATPFLYDLGYQFGKLMYILDAYEDYEQDVFKGNFNPLAVYFGGQRRLEEGQLEVVRDLILNLESQVTGAMEILPLTLEQKELYQSRLVSNLALRLYKERVVPTTWRESVAQRWDFAKDFANRVLCPSQVWWRQLNYYVLVFAVFVSPQTAEYLPADGKMEVLKWGALFTATLAGLGLAGVVRRRRKKEKREPKKQKRFRAFFEGMMNVLFRRNNSCSNCTSECCSNCCSACCEQICKSDNPWFWILILLAIILTAGLVVLILFLAGII